MIKVRGYGPGVWRKIRVNAAGHQVAKSAAQATEAEAWAFPEKSMVGD